MRKYIGRPAAAFGLLLFVSSLCWLFVNPAPDSRRTQLDPVVRPQPAFSLVVLDPGHGGQDSGAMCGGVTEKDLTFDVAQRVGRLLEAHGLGTWLTRSGDAYVSLQDRAALANRATDCIFVSIHFNDTKRQGANGVETYFAMHQQEVAPALAAWLPFLKRASNEEATLESQSLAGFIQQAVVERTKAVNRGTKAEQFYVIANVRHPAVLVEGGFMTNKEEIVKLGNGEYRESMAAAIAAGIDKYRQLFIQRAAAAAPHS